MSARINSLTRFVHGRRLGSLHQICDGCIFQNIIFRFPHSLKKGPHRWQAGQQLVVDTAAGTALTQGGNDVANAHEMRRAGGDQTGRATAV